MFTTLIEAFICRSKEEERGITFVNGHDKETYVSYRELYDQALEILYCLQSRGLKNRDLIIFQLEDNEVFIKYFWACLLGGIIPVPVSRGTNKEHRSKIFKIVDVLGDGYLLTDEKHYQFIKEREIDVSEELTIEKEKVILIEEINLEKRKGKLHNSEPSDIAFIQFSSGSTGNPKGVTLTQANLVANINAMIVGTETTYEDSCISWLPLTHDMGMIGLHLLPIVLGINQYIMPTSVFIRNPILWLKKVNEHRITITCSPNFGYNYFLRYLKPHTCEGWDLSCLKLIINGAEPISYELINRFTNVMGQYGLKQTVMFNVYGLAEASLAVSFPKVGEGLLAANVDRRSLNFGQTVELRDNSIDENIIPIVDLGYPVKNCMIRICDNKNNSLMENTVGYICIKGENVTSGYYNNQEETKEIIDDNGWLNTGDLGFMRNGRLYVTGRAKDLIIINGQNYYPHDIERVISEIGEFALGEVAACSVYNPQIDQEEINVFVIYKKKLKEFVELAQILEKNIIRKIGIKVSSIIPIKRMPKTTSGKIKRFKLAEDFLKGDFDHLISEINGLKESLFISQTETYQLTEIETILLNICREVLGNNTIGVNDSFADIGGSSLQLVQVHEQLEKVFPGRVAISDLYSYSSVSELAKQLEKPHVIHLNGVELPSQYFNADSRQKEGVFEAHFPITKVRSLDNIAQENNVRLADVLVAVLGNLLTQISGMGEINVQTMVMGKNIVEPININFNEISDLPSLLMHVSRSILSAKSYNLNLIDIVSLDKQEFEIIPFLYFKNLKDINEKINDIYDVMIEVIEDEGSLIFLCKFDSKRLNKQQIQEMFSNYIKLLSRIAGL